MVREEARYPYVERKMRLPRESKAKEARQYTVDCHMACRLVDGAWIT